MVIVLALVIAAAPAARADDETSASDRLRILYSSRFTFTAEGDPLVTVEIMGGQRSVELWAEGGLAVRPDGDGGAEVSGGDRWTVTLSEAAPATVREWTVVERVAPDDDAGAEAAVARWTARGLTARRFETGTVFGIAGAVMDSRATLIAVDPVAPGKGDARARGIGAQYALSTSVHPELVRRPRGLLTAQSATTKVTNPSVLWFAPARPGAFITVRGVVTGGGGSTLATGRADRRYAGRVYVAVGRDGALTVVNAIGAEKLLAGLVPAEMFPSAPPSALASQAIAARTDLIGKLGTRHLEDPFLICASQHCQVYAGAGHEDRRTDAAVASTRGRVLRRPGGELIDVRYSADCGGHGEHNENIWGGPPDPVLRGKRDAAAADRFAGPLDGAALAAFIADADRASYCGRARAPAGRHRWMVRSTTDALTRSIAAELPGVGHVTAIVPEARGVSGRVSRLTVGGDRGRAVVTGDLRIRRLLGGLRSTLFTVATEGPVARPTAFVFHGAGFGHGVGMCQVGAMNMAERGATADAILRHYFPGSAVHRLY